MLLKNNKIKDFQWGKGMGPPLLFGCNESTSLYKVSKRSLRMRGRVRGDTHSSCHLGFSTFMILQPFKGWAWT